MSRGPSTFRQRDLDRAIQVAQHRGLTVYEIVVEGARVILRTSGSPPDKPIAEPEEVVL